MNQIDTKTQLLEDIYEQVKASVEKRIHTKYDAIFHCPHDKAVLDTVRELAEYEYYRQQEEE